MHQPPNVAALAVPALRRRGSARQGPFHDAVYVVLVRSQALDAALIFGGLRPHQQALWRFLVVAAVRLCLNSAMVAAATRSLGVHHLLAQVTATSVVLLWIFSGNRWWTFADEP